MRVYKPKDNVQKKPYYTNRFHKVPHVPKESVDSDEIFTSDLEAIKAKFEVLDAYIQVGQMVVFIKPQDNYGVLELMRDELDYTQLSEMSAIDFLAQKNSFEVFYQMLSMKKRKRIRVKMTIAKGDAVNTVEPLFRSADWSEREMYDMFGIEANGHPFMKRILMPYDWHDHPLLKTYPLQGDEAASWYEVDKIFGKEARDVIGPELRDSAHIDRYDTERFARLGHEVPFGAKFKENELNADIEFQEPKGVFMVTKFDASKTVTITDRDR